MTQPTSSTIILSILPNASVSSVILVKVERETKKHFSFGAYLTRNAMETRKNKTQRQTQREKIHSYGGYFHYKSERHSVPKLEEAYGVWKRF